MLGMALQWLAIVNPTSAGGRSLHRWTQVSPLLRRLGLRFDEVFTEGPGHATQLAREAVETYDRILSVGGDGTTYEILNGMLTSPTVVPLGIVPAGTGNDLPNAFGLPLDLRQACHVIASGVPRSVDAAVVRGRGFDGRPVQKYWAGVASFGFDADVTYYANLLSKSLPGTLNYVRGIMKGLITVKEHLFRVTLLREGQVGQVVDLAGFLLAVGNGCYYGAGMKVCPDASVYDGLLNVTFLRGIPKLEFLRVFPRVYSGTHLTHPAIQTYTADELIIQNPHKVRFQVDGEVLGHTPARVKVLPKAFKVLHNHV